MHVKATMDLSVFAGNLFLHEITDLSGFACNNNVNANKNDLGHTQVLTSLKLENVDLSGWLVSQF